MQNGSTNVEQSKATDVRTNAQCRTPSPAGARVKAAFERRGLSVTAWAKKNGFSSALVWRVLDRGTGARGESHRIAVALGLKKDATVGSLDTFDPAAAAAEDDAAN